MSLDRSLDEIIKDKKKSSVFRKPRKSDRQNRIDKKRGKRPVKRFTSQIPSIDNEPWQHDLNQEDDLPQSKKLYREKGRDRNSSTESLYIVLIENLHYELSEENVRSFLSEFHPSSILMDYDRAGRSEGTCRAFFSSKEEAEHAVESLDGHFVNNQPIKLFLKPPTSLLDRISSPVNARSSHKKASFKDLRDPGNEKEIAHVHPISHEDLDRELDAYAASYQTPTNCEHMPKESPDNTKPIETENKGFVSVSVQNTEDMQLDNS
ncbi:THO complex subunit [Schizosaccharomyces cryophilus OY26]|uniref:THO complex subunit n=1 Tax=Schizosaccharomyces cryophilus (strain OY26 / ATCC MYA-4695 / CBS 11777 / NBRC 106824 / NRRL Y48691) TaxID=653667 RepID=S9XBD4_SCHCR|nr:THO complex subunit [Schizosaccharomyces cryophilus OY26]EPY51076.1 THO complex subunit [Schizosaccharomyces cryophilus OY26]